MWEMQRVPHECGIQISAWDGVIVNACGWVWGETKQRKRNEKKMGRKEKKKIKDRHLLYQSSVMWIWETSAVFSRFTRWSWVDPENAQSIISRAQKHVLTFSMEIRAQNRSHKWLHMHRVLLSRYGFTWFWVPNFPQEKIGATYFRNKLTIYSNLKIRSIVASQIKGVPKSA